MVRIEKKPEPIPDFSEFDPPIYSTCFQGHGSTAIFWLSHIPLYLSSSIRWDEEGRYTQKPHLPYHIVGNTCRFIKMKSGRYSRKRHRFSTPWETDSILRKWGRILRDPGSTWKKLDLYLAVFPDIWIFELPIGRGSDSILFFKV